MRRPGLDNLRRLQIAKRINERCRKTRACEACGAVNGVVKKAGNSALKITHDKFRAFNASSSVKKIPPPSKIVFDRSFDEARTSNADVEKHYKKAQDDMNANGKPSSCRIADIMMAACLTSAAVRAGGVMGAAEGSDMLVLMYKAEIHRRLWIVNGSVL